MPLAREQEPEFLIEYEHCGPLAAPDRLAEVLHDEQRLAGAGRTDGQRTRTSGHALADQLVECGKAAFDQISGEAPALLRGDQSRKYLDSASADDEVVVAAAEYLAATFRDFQPAALRAVDRRKLFELRDAVRNTVHGAVVRFAGQIVEHDNG